VNAHEDEAQEQQRLTQISTRWTMLCEAHAGADAATAAQASLLQRYTRPVYRYLLGAVRDPDVAADLAQEFVYRFLRGDFRRADPERGRFRDYLKRALCHLVTDHHRARQAWPRQLAEAGAEPAAPAAEEPDRDREFLAAWREELLKRTWAALAQAQPTYHAVLRFRVDNPEVSSPQMAEQLTAQLGKPLTPDGVRKALERAHNKFADLLLNEVASSLQAPSLPDLRDELRELDLLKYCQSALKRRE
jgi:RNA polymerase sigma-70 factor (ECF subfamily)